ncbi:MAG: hypothetical protein AAGH38_07145 [Pseudomonadota bacterium]
MDVDDIDAWIDPFIGEWVLDAASATFHQGETPTSGKQVIARVGADLNFSIELSYEAAATEKNRLVSRPDGRPEVFNGGDLADAIVTRLPTRGVLETVASYKGVERMSVTRSLSVDGMSMIVKQTVTLPDQTQVANEATYHRLQ